MMKKFIILFCILIFSVESFALDNRYPLEMLRAKKLDQVIKRVNNIYSFINLYALQTGSLPSSITLLSSKYANVNTAGFLDNDQLSFTVDSVNYTVTFPSIIPSDSSDLIKGLYKEHTELDVNGVVNSDLSLTIGLEANTIKFLSYKSRIEDLETGTALISETSPTCTPSTNTGKIWYQPDSNGGFNISYCKPGWQLLSNRITIAIFRPTVAELGNITPPAGTIAYAKNPANEIHEYVFDGTAWIEVQN